jgi:hypothetical protein
MRLLQSWQVPSKERGAPPLFPRASLGERIPSTLPREENEDRVRRSLYSTQRSENKGFRGQSKY